MASQTISNSLLSSDFDGTTLVHAQALLEITRPPLPDCKSIFGLTRNPYSRALSSYLHLKRQAGPSLSSLLNEAKCGLGDDLTFHDFLKILVDRNRNDAKAWDPHYRPQVFNLHLSDLTPSYLGRLELIEDAFEYLSTFGVPIRPSMGHATNANESYAQIIRPREAELIENIYSEDFVALGYRPDLASNYIPPALTSAPSISDSYSTLFRDFNDKISEASIEKVN